MTHVEHFRPSAGSERSASVLFFGRNDCEATQKALEHLRVLGFDITYVESKRRGERLPEEISQWSGNYILCFRSLFIIPKLLIERASIAAINFHPAPVEYPGSGCLNFALYDNASHYGVTAHIMNEKVDNGAVIECRKFPILPRDTVDTLLKRTHVKLLDLFFDLATDLALGGKSLLAEKIEASRNVQWVGEARRMKDLEALQNISLEVDARELERIIRATYTPNFPPRIRFHGYEFILKSNIKI